MTATPRAVELATAAALAASDKLASEIVILDVSEQLVITDCFVLASASNDRQVGPIVDEVEERLRPLGAKPVRREGDREGRWVLLDFVDVVVHVQHAEERELLLASSGSGRTARSSSSRRARTLARAGSRAR